MISGKLVLISLQPNMIRYALLGNVPVEVNQQICVGMRQTSYDICL